MIGWIVLPLILLGIAGATIRAMYLADVPGIKQAVDPWLKKIDFLLPYIPPWWVFIIAIIAVIVWYNISRKSAIKSSFKQFALRNGFAYVPPERIDANDNDGKKIYGCVSGVSPFGPIETYIHYTPGSSGSNGIGPTRKSTSGSYSLTMILQMEKWKYETSISKNFFHDSRMMSFITEKVGSVMESMTGMNIPTSSDVKTGDQEFDQLIIISGKESHQIVQQLNPDKKQALKEFAEKYTFYYRNGNLHVSNLDDPKSVGYLNEVYKDLLHLANRLEN